MSGIREDLLDIELPNELQQGIDVINWIDSTVSIDSCTLQVEEYGFFLTWRAKDKSGQGHVLDFSNVTNIRTGVVPIDPILLKISKFDQYIIDDSNEDQEPLKNRTLTFCSCPDDLVEVVYTNFIFPNAFSRDYWNDEITKLSLIGSRRNLSPHAALVKSWKKLLLSSVIDEKIPIKSISRTFCASSTVDKQVLRTAAELGICPGKKADYIMAKDFTLDIFMQICNIMFPRKDIDVVFKSITAGEEATISQLVKFHNDQQRDPRLHPEKVPRYDKMQVNDIIKKYEKNPVLAERGLMSKDGFLNYFLSDETCMIKKSLLSVHQNMDFPLSHYFISSSHNTYLKGAQVKGTSTVEMYRQVLLSGCRCIELDCWDGTGANLGEPIITHGKAMCTEILFKDVIEAIKEFAFIKSPYPVILSFENHCLLPMQEKMAKYCDTIFGDLLLKEPLEEFPTSIGHSLPSPNKMKYKILIKNKKLGKTEEKDQLQKYWKRRRAIQAIKESRVSGPSSFIHLAGVGENTFAIEESHQGELIDEQKTIENNDQELQNTIECQITNDALSSNDGNEFQPNKDFTLNENATDFNDYGNGGCPVENRNSVTSDEDSSPDISLKMYEAKRKEKEIDSWSEGEEEDIIMDTELTKDFISKTTIFDNKQDIQNKTVDNVVKRRKRSLLSSVRRKVWGKSDSNKLTARSAREEKEDRNSAPQSPNIDVNDKSSPATTSLTDITSSHPSVTIADEKRSNVTLKSQIGTPIDFVHVVRGPNLSTDIIHRQIYREKNVGGSPSDIVESSGLVPDTSENILEIEAGTDPNEETVGFSDVDLEVIETLEKDEGATDISNDVINGPSENKYDNPRNKSKGNAKAEPPTTNTIHPYLSSLVVYTQPKPFKGFYCAEKENLSHIMSSFSETKAFELLKSNPMMLVRYNKRQLTRIYPMGMRLDSSNLMPQEFWNAGCQLVCLNYQTPDLPMQLNLGKFDLNGQSGYLLKPDIMRRADRNFDPFIKDPVDGLVAADYSVQVLSGYFLSDKKVGTYVTVELYGLFEDCKGRSYKTGLFPSNGLNPIYNSELCKFDRIICPEIGMLRFAVYDDHDKLLGQRVLPLESIQCGYRHVSLRTAGNATLPLAMIFCKITMDIHTLKGMEDILRRLENPLLSNEAKNESTTEKERQRRTMSDGDVSHDQVSDDTKVPLNEEDPNGDVTSILQGNGKPKNRMRLAKKRTKSQLLGP